MRTFIKEIKNYLKFLKSQTKNKKKNIYFYSENSNYKNYLIEILNKLNNSNKFKIIYFTSDEKDILDHAGIETYFIGKGLIRIIFFTFLKCDLMIMTLTDLNNYEIKKSKNCKSYLYVFHSLMSVFKGYNKNAFQNYDIIFTNGEYQKKELKIMEEQNNLRKKLIFNVGYTYINNLKKKINKTIKDDTILFAPSWIKQKNDLIEKYGQKIIAELIKINKVILRPHPQSLIKSKNEITSIVKKFQFNPRFIFNNNLEKISTLDVSSILVTDNGGMAMEYYILYNRPVISINYLDKIHNEDYKTLGLEALEDSFKKEFTKVIEINDIGRIKEISENYIKNFKFDKKKLDSFLNKNGIILEEASENAYSKICELMSDLD